MLAAPALRAALAIALALASARCAGDAPPPGDAAAAAGPELVVALEAVTALAVDDRAIAVADAAGRVRRVAPAGATAGPIEEVASGQPGPCCLRLDDDALYWANVGSHAADFRDGGLFTADRDGGAPQQLAAPWLPSAVAVADGYVYWTDIDGGEVGRVARDGGATESLHRSDSSKTSVAVADGVLAWTAGGAEDDVVLHDLGTGARTVVSRDEYSPDAVVWLGGDLAWIERGPPGGERAGIRAWRGGAPVDLVLDEPGATDLVVHRGALYWLSAGRVRRLDPAGGAPSTLVEGRIAPRALTGHGERLYWAEDAGVLALPLP
jgi:hypothetical protein